ncbi:MAG: alpha/beta hydrolase [Deltaproteobacteria bacterium]|nr:alpha/beta hydrolase [Deltaproteobacteria bacterium]
MSLYIVERGQGPAILLVHGSAADAEAFTIPLALLSDEKGERPHRVVAYDRRGTRRSALSAAEQGEQGPTVEDHAEDAARIISERGLAPALAVGSSFGAVVALELARRHRSSLRGIALMEPPISASDTDPAVPDGFWAEFEEHRTAGGPEASAEYFLRRVLGDGFARLTEAHLRRALSHAEAIRLDARALERYRVRYDTLSTLGVPTLLLGGARSPAYFAKTMDALEKALGPWCLRRQTLSAGHMMYAEAARSFRDAIFDFERLLSSTSSRG